MKAAIYIRASTEDQVEAGTPETQRMKCRDYCEKMGWNVVAEFKDDGYSGTTLIVERPEGRRLFERIRASEFDVVVTSDDQRLSRSHSVMEWGFIIDSLSEGNCCTASPQAGLENPSDFAGRLMRILKLAFSAKERDDIIERQQAGRYRASREARYSAGQINYGMEWDNSSKAWVVNEKEYFVLREIARLIKAGTSVTEIARILNKDLEKYPLKIKLETVNKDEKIKARRKWTAANVSSKFASDFLWNGKRMFTTDEGKQKEIQIVKHPFFTREEVEEIRYLLRQKRRPSISRTKRNLEEAERTNFLLKGIGYCSCGKPLYIQDFRPSGKSYSYYRCRDEACKLSTDSKKVDDLTWVLFTEKMIDPKIIRQSILEGEFIADKTRKDLEAIIDSSQKRLKEIRREIEVYVVEKAKGRLSEETYEKLVDDLERDEAEVMNSYRRAVNTLNRPKEVDEASERVAKKFLEGIGIVKQAQRLASPLAKMNYTEEQKKKLRKLIHKAVGFDIGRMETKEDLGDLIFKLKKKMLDEFGAADGKVIVSKEKIEVKGNIRVDPEVEILTNQTLAQTTFG